MKNYFAASAALLLSSALVSSACLSGDLDPVDPLPGSGAVVTGNEYPEGPYGTTAGEVITEYLFNGYPDSTVASGPDARQEVPLSAFYNPTGEGIYGPDDLFPEGQPKPIALVVNVSAVWCGPCQFEALNILPEEYAHYHPLGAELLLVLADSVEPGSPATFDNLDNWTSAYNVNYPATIDPQYQLGALFDTSSFPANMIIDTRTMTIVEVVTGIPQEAFWAKLEEVLDS